MERIKNLGLLFFSMNILYWIILLSVAFTCFADVSDQTKSSSPPVVPDQTQSSSASDQTQSTSTPAVSEQTRTSSTSTKKSKEEDELTLQPLPGKDETFSNIRSKNKTFVDKTPFIEELLDDGRQCVLFTRPRRFGKTNFLQMLQAFFMGKKDLFEGTHIFPRGNTDEKNGDWKEYPVVYLDIGRFAKYGRKKPSVERFKNNFYNQVMNIGIFYQVRGCTSVSVLVQKLFRKFGFPVIILVDEYDSPFTRILHRRPDGSITEEEKVLLDGMKDLLEEVFDEIKSLISEGFVKLTFITGVARLAFDGLPGSGPNNVVTLTDKYSCMVGFTESEIEKYLGPHVVKFAKTEDTSSQEIIKRLFKMYGGYVFSNTGRTEVVNPVSVLECLANEKFDNYWCPTHSLDVVLDKMCADEVTPEHFAGLEVMLTSLHARSPTHNEIPTSIYLLLYGYLTIREYNNQMNLVILDYPNDEIKDVLVNNLKIRLMLHHPAQLGKEQINILRFLQLKQVSALVKVLNKLGFRNQAPANYQLKLKDEFKCTTILYIIFRIIGLNTKIGVKMVNLPKRNELGDLDLLIMTEAMTFVIEAKYEKEDEVMCLKKLLDYIDNNENAFLHHIAKSRDQCNLQNTAEIYLLGLNFKEDPNVSTQSIETFIGLPFQPWEPSKRRESKEAMKLWFNHIEIKGGDTELKSIWNKLKSKYESVFLDKAVW